MVVKLVQKDYIRIENFFNENTYQIPALAVLNGKFPGRVFVDNNEKPEIALVWDISRWAYISCKELLPRHKSFITEVFNSEILPVLKMLGEQRFEVYADNDTSWDCILNEALNEYKLDRHYKNTFVLNKEKFLEFTSNLKVPQDIEICEINFPIIPDEFSKYVEKDWSNKAVFGMMIKKNKNIISQCVNNGFIYNNYYFIDLDTFNFTERNNGYGTLISYKLICKELTKGLSPLWETTTNNISSQRVAYKLGFEKVCEYPVYSISGY